MSYYEWLGAIMLTFCALVVALIVAMMAFVAIRSLLQEFKEL